MDYADSRHHFASFDRSTLFKGTVEDCVEGSVVEFGEGLVVEFGEGLVVEFARE